MSPQEEMTAWVSLEYLLWVMASVQFCRLVLTRVAG